MTTLPLKTTSSSLTTPYTRISSIIPTMLFTLPFVLCIWRRSLRRIISLSCSKFFNSFCTSLGLLDSHFLCFVRPTKKIRKTRIFLHYPMYNKYKQLVRDSEGQFYNYQIRLIFSAMEIFKSKHPQISKRKLYLSTTSPYATSQFFHAFWDMHIYLYIYTSTLGVHFVIIWNLEFLPIEQLYIFEDIFFILYHYFSIMTIFYGDFDCNSSVSLHVLIIFFFHHSLSLTYMYIFATYFIIDLIILCICDCMLSAVN